MSTNGTKGTESKVAPSVTIDDAVDLAKRAFALKKYEDAVDHYATALELATTEFGDNAPEIADLYFAYGKALLENAIVQNSVLGKEQEENEASGENKESASGSGHEPILSFSGDAEDVEDNTVDLFQQAAKDVEEVDAAEADVAQDENDEPEDDFNAAWDVLDLARAIYDKQKDLDENDDIKLKLADTYIALGDVSLETEKFDQAITDYEAALSLKEKLLPITSRQIAEAHYKLSIVLDLTSGRLADAIIHAEKALSCIDARLSALKERSGQQPVITDSSALKDNPKGKGKAKDVSALQNSISGMSESEVQHELKDLGELRKDLALKIEELKTSPNETLATSAPEMAARALDKELAIGSSGTISDNGPVNDLTSLLVKKKKAPKDEEAGASSKRKAEEENDTSGPEKKAKTDNTEEQ